MKRQMQFWRSLEIARMYSLQLRIKDLPKRINQTMGKHWSIKHKESKKWITLIGAHVRWNYPEAPLQKARLTFIRASSIAPDFDNLVHSFKLCTDALIKLNIIKDDNMDVIGQPDYQWIKASPGKGYVIIKVEEEASLGIHVEGN